MKQEFEAITKERGVSLLEEMGKSVFNEGGNWGGGIGSVMFVSHAKRMFEKLLNSRQCPVLAGPGHATGNPEKTIRYSIADAELQRKFYEEHKDDDFNRRGLNEQ